MPFKILDSVAYFALAVPLHDFPQLLSDHLKDNPDTPEIELFGEQLTRTDFPAEKMPEFVTRVCSWGGKQGIRILDRVLISNKPEEISEALRKASSSLAVGRLAEALTEVCKLKYLKVSFASKHLRFLRPDICPVFDSVLHAALPYTPDETGYSVFAKDCVSLVKALAENQISSPRPRAGGAWFVADVEGAVYVFADRAMKRLRT
jgi:hypothetical protein